MHSTVLMAHTYGPAEVLQFAELELPKLAAETARIQVMAAGINPIDARRMSGEFRHGTLPQTFGTEFAGVIVEVNDPQSKWKVGDEVLGSGAGFTHATVIDVPVSNLVARPANLDWLVAGSLAGAAQTAMTILQELQEKGPVKSLLIHGASGGVGSITVQLARELGIDVVATASQRNHEYLENLGATPVLYGAGLTERLQAIHPEKFDASLDMAGTEDATQASLATVKNDGFLGTIAGRPLSSSRIQPMWVKRNKANLQHVVDGVAEGRLSWLVSNSYPFAQAAEAYSAILQGHTWGKSVLSF
ncbi:NADP-dependent oxidoreductase [Pseudomonas sp. 5P_3.1_Bac2]|uniref:NADP-dependent oxidoreductase n=1 Tax=Pseudomonas sp. 5P_3.1_Bac2 TaxID=2971617 RepID=UPI0021C66433|nr:NADP-dependent oxidoreductase [Pseudomonas sp. 5P_3.1_Bac2]MCU1717288.1 NADP-dependent oxidoreductase [Pseudomonas sp. 5P_3.1_Bac2]